MYQLVAIAIIWYVNAFVFVCVCVCVCQRACMS